MIAKSSLTIAFFLIFSQIIIAQEPSKKDTEDWLLKKIQIFEIHNWKDYQFDQNGKLHQKFTFEAAGYGYYNYNIITLKTIDAIEIFDWESPNKTEKQVVLKFYSSEDNIEFYGGNDSNPEFRDKGNEQAIAFKLEVKENDMINRIKKAFIHLIELNGGKMKKDVF